MRFWHDRFRFTAAIRSGLMIPLVLFAFSCAEIQAPKPDPFIGENAPPPQQEFRWSNGKAPKTLDPARAAASPEIDIVRALFEGLTDLDSANTNAVSAVAVKWKFSEDFKTWTFELRRDAKWSNGNPVTAEDFVRSWKRLSELGNKVPQRNLFKNILGMDSENVLPVFPDEEPGAASQNNDLEKMLAMRLQQDVNSDPKPIPVPSESPQTNPSEGGKSDDPESKRLVTPTFGVEAVNALTLKVTLIRPDKEFPLLVAHPLFRPVFGESDEFEKTDLSTGLVTNGAFRLISVKTDGITIERNPDYWSQEEIKLQRVRFVPSETAENALAAYRAGELDAVTNADFQPLALKLLKPFEEFQQTTHGAVNLYEFNLREKPFDDLRVRRALAVAIERERLTEDDMDGITRPALSFLPFERSPDAITQDLQKARELLTEAGFPGGEGFPTVRLLVNRNNTQQKIARSVAKMWLKNLGVKTEIIAKDRAEFELALTNHEFSLVRRGVVLPTHNEMVNMLSMFDTDQGDANPAVADPAANPADNSGETSSAEEDITDADLELGVRTNPDNQTADKTVEPVAETANETIMTEKEALEKLPGIPLYFPTSFSLIKPYIRGFEMNAFDALSLKNVSIDSNWQPAQNQPKANSK